MEMGGDQRRVARGLHPSHDRASAIRGTVMKRQVWLTHEECDLVYRALGVVGEHLSERVRVTPNSMDKFGLMWTRDQLQLVREKFFPNEEQP